MKCFSFNGRSSRLTFWREMLGVNLVFALVWVAGIFASMAVGKAGLMLLVGSIPLVVWYLAAGVRRLHDIDRSWAWLILYWGLPIALVFASSPFEADPRPEAAWLVFALSCFGLVISLWGLWEVGFRRGSAGPNRFGPPSDGQGPRPVPPPQEDSLSRWASGLD